MKINKKRVLVTGGGTFLGDTVALALLAEGAEVTLLVRPENEERLSAFKTQMRVIVVDIWNPASLRGRARGHFCVVNTVGSTVADPQQGLTHHRLNFVSARNVVNMVISDGVPHAILMSAVNAPWMSRDYISAKREAEEYVYRVGVSTTIIRAPLLYVRGQQRSLFWAMLSALGTTPPFSWTRLSRIAPMPIDVLARGTARIALNSKPSRDIFYAPDLRRLNTQDELRSQIAVRTPQPLSDDGLEDDTQPRRRGIELIDEDTPFGWTPSGDDY